MVCANFASYTGCSSGFGFANRWNMGCHIGFGGVAGGFWFSADFTAWVAHATSTEQRPIGNYLGIYAISRCLLYGGAVWRR
jgi:hypothetical protein